LLPTELLQITTISNLRLLKLKKRKVKKKKRTRKLLLKQRQLQLHVVKLQQKLQKKLKKNHSCLLILRRSNSKNNLLSNTQLHQHLKLNLRLSKKRVLLKMRPRLKRAQTHKCLEPQARMSKMPSVQIRLIIKQIWNLLPLLSRLQPKKMTRVLPRETIHSYNRLDQTRCLSENLSSRTHIALSSLFNLNTSTQTPKLQCNKTSLETK